MSNTYEELSIGILSTDLDVGENENGVKVLEYGTNVNHTTVMNLDTTLGAIAGGASLGLGKKLYTFPEGPIVINFITMSVALTQTEDNITADTPEVGLGTVVASGAVAVLSGTATFENLLTGQVAADCDGTPTVKTVVANFVMEAADAHTMFLNFADGWAADGDAAAEITGTVVVNWQKLSA